MEQDLALNDRERFIQHSMSVIIVDSLIRKLRSDKGLLERMSLIQPHEMKGIMEEIRIGRCRRLSNEEVSHLYEEMKEEMLLGSEIHSESNKFGDEEKYI